MQLNIQPFNDDGFKKINIVDVLKIDPDEICDEDEKQNVDKRSNDKRSNFDSAGEDMASIGNVEDYDDEDDDFFDDDEIVDPVNQFFCRVIVSCTHPSLCNILLNARLFVFECTHRCTIGIWITNIWIEDSINLVFRSVILSVIQIPGSYYEMVPLNEEMYCQHSNDDIETFIWFFAINLIFLGGIVRKVNWPVKILGWWSWGGETNYQFCWIRRILSAAKTFQLSAQCVRMDKTSHFSLGKMGEQNI